MDIDGVSEERLRVEEPIWEVKCLLCRSVRITTDAYEARLFASQHHVKRLGTLKRCPASTGYPQAVDNRTLYTQRMIGWQEVLPGRGDETIKDAGRWA